MFNPCIIVPAIVCALFLYLGSGLTLCKVSHAPSPLPTIPIPPSFVTRALRLVKPREARVRALDRPPPPPALLQPACGGMAVLICGAVFSLLSLPIFSAMVVIYLFYANILIEV